MKSLFKALLGAGVLAAHLSSMAGVADTIQTSVSVFKPTVSYTGVAAFDIVVENKGGNVANSVTVKSTSEIGTFRSVEGNVPCGGSGSTASCSFGQMRPGDRFAFTVLFNVPQAPANPPTDPQLFLTTETRYSEGGNGPKSKPLNSAYDIDSLLTLTAPSGTEIESVVPSQAADFIIGTVSGDGFSTTAKVPTVASRTSATIVEADFSEGCTNFVTCWKSTISIPASFEVAPHLRITLHQDASNIKSGTQIGSVIIWYRPDGSTSEFQVGPCADASTPTGTGIPCITKATHYKSRSVEGWTRALDGDMVWELLNTLNGSYRLP